MPTTIDTIPGVVQRLYELVAEPDAAFLGRPFTPDGHLVGSLGEVLASHYSSETSGEPAAQALRVTTPGR